MVEYLKEIKVLSTELRDLLTLLKDEIETNLQHSRRVMLVDLITHINSLNRDNYYHNKEIYSKLMVNLNIALKTGKIYLDEL